MPGPGSHKYDKKRRAPRWASGGRARARRLQGRSGSGEAAAWRGLWLALPQTPGWGPSGARVAGPRVSRVSGPLYPGEASGRRLPSRSAVPGYLREPPGTDLYEWSSPL